MVLHWNLADWESPKKEDYFSKVTRMFFAGINWHKISPATDTTSETWKLPPGTLRMPTKRFYKERTASKRNKGALLLTPSGRVQCVLDHTDNNYCSVLRAAVLMKQFYRRVWHKEWPGSCYQSTVGTIKYLSLQKVQKTVDVPVWQFDGDRFGRCYSATKTETKASLFLSFYFLWSLNYSSVIANKAQTSGYFKEIEHNYYFISRTTVTMFSEAHCRFRPGRI